MIMAPSSYGPKMAGQSLPSQTVPSCTCRLHTPALQSMATSKPRLVKARKRPSLMTMHFLCNARHAASLLGCVRQVQALARPPCQQWQRIQTGAKSAFPGRTAFVHSNKISCHLQPSASLRSSNGSGVARSLLSGSLFAGGLGATDSNRSL